MNIEKLKEQLIFHEGEKLKPYKCTSGKLTIGVGRNLEDKGISKVESRQMLHADVLEFYDLLYSSYPQITRLDDARQNVLVNMAFNIGVNGLMGFTKMFNALALKDFELAAKEMLDSKWARQVKGRALDLAAQMRTGEFQ